MIPLLWGESVGALYFAVASKLKYQSSVQWGLPWWLSGKESTCQCRRCGFDPWSRKIPWRRKWQPTPVFLPGKSHGQRILVGYSLWGHKRVGHDWATEQNCSIACPRWGVLSKNRWELAVYTKDGWTLPWLWVFPKWQQILKTFRPLSTLTDGGLTSLEMLVLTDKKPCFLHRSLSKLPFPSCCFSLPWLAQPPWPFFYLSVVYDLGKGRKCPCSYINVCVLKCQNAPGGSKLLNKYT